jgi:hypothetical protein
VGVGNSYAVEVLAVRLRGETEDALAEVAGQPVRLLVHTDSASVPEPEPRPSSSRAPVTSPRTAPEERLRHQAPKP